MTIQEAIVEFLTKWEETNRSDLHAFAAAGIEYFKTVVIDAPPPSTQSATASKSSKY